MAIERRHQKRLSTEIDAELIYRRRSFQAQIENISLDGVMVRTSSLTAPRGTLVKIGLNVNGRDWQIAALVIHQDQNRTGMMLQMPQPELLRHLAALPLSKGARRNTLERTHHYLPARPGILMERHSH